MIQSEAAVPATHNTDGSRETRVSGFTLQVLGVSILWVSGIGVFVFSWLNYGVDTTETDLLATVMLILMLPFVVGLGLVVVARRAGSALLGMMGLLLLVLLSTPAGPNGAEGAGGSLMAAAVVVSGLLLLGGAIATLRTDKQ